MMGTDCSDIVRLLHGRSDSHVSHQDLMIDRVGRNPVWRVHRRGIVQALCYVKFQDSDWWFERELQVLDVVRHLSAHHDWIAAPELLYSDPSTRATVVTRVPGERLVSFLKNARRMDRNPFRSRGRLTRFFDALEHTLRFMEALHACRVPDQGVLYNHTLTGVRDRVLKKLRRGIDAGALRVDEPVLADLEALDLTAFEQEPRVLCGDAGLGNFLWDGHRVAWVDFEDCGFGNPARDFFELRQSVDWVNEKWWYWSAQQASSMIPPVADATEELMYTLEWKLDHHWKNRQAGSTRYVRRFEKEVRGAVAQLPSLGS